MFLSSRHRELGFVDLKHTLAIQLLASLTMVDYWRLSFLLCLHILLHLPEAGFVVALVLLGKNPMFVERRLRFLEEVFATDRRRLGLRSLASKVIRDCDCEEYLYQMVFAHSSSFAPVAPVPRREMIRGLVVPTRR